MHIGFINIASLQLKENSLQQKQKRKKEGKYERKRKRENITERGRRGKAQERERALPV